MYATMVTFHQVKAGNELADSEDRASTMLGGQPRATGGRSPETRFAVADGGAEAYDSGRWAAMLTQSFAPGLDADPEWPPDLVPGAIAAWYGRMQRRWEDRLPEQFPTIFAARRHREKGSFATLVGGRLEGLDGGRPRWRAVAIGDTVLFHVRDRHLLEHFPPLRPDDFRRAPAGVRTRREDMERMMEATRGHEGRHDLADGDLLYVATDTLAEWILRARDERGEDALWRLLGRMSHPHRFERMIEAERTFGLRNDDMTLLRIRISERPPRAVAVCL